MSSSFLLASLALVAAAGPVPKGKPSIAGRGRAPALHVAAASDVPSGKPPVVSQVSVQVPEGEEAAAIEGMLAIKVGQPLSLRAVRRTVQLLYQLGRFSNVVVRAAASGKGPAGEDQVMVVVECLPKRIIKTVSFRIDTRLPALSPEALRKAANLPPGEELYENRLAAAVEGVRSAYVRRGYRQAHVTATSDGARAASVEIQVQEGQPTRVASVSLGPDPGLPEQELKRRLETRPGAILDLDVLEEDVRAVRTVLRGAGFYRATVKAPVVEAGPETAAVRIPVEPGPRIFFRFSGNAWFSDEELRAHLGYDGEQPLDAPAIEAASAQLADFLRARGFLEARVAAEERSLGSRAVVLFRVEEGRRYRLGAVGFSGVSARSPEWLASRLVEALEEEATDESRGRRAELDHLAAASGAPVPEPAPSSQRLDPTGVYYEPAWTRAIGRLLDLYRDDGYIDAAQEGTRVALDARRGVVDVEIRLREGVQTRVDSISFEGNQALTLRELARESKLAPGDPLSFARVEQTRLALLDRYARAGYAYARIEETEELSADRRTAALRFRVDEGPQVHVANVVVAGAKRTREDVVRGALSLRSGDLFDPEAVARSQAALLRLNVFRAVSLRLNDPEVPEATKDLTVDVTERPWQTISTGGGFSIADGPRAFIEYSQPNLGGRALEFTARGKVNYPLDTPLAPRPDLAGKAFTERIEGRADVGLRYPRIHFLPFTAGARLDAIAERLHRKAYDLTRASGVLGFDWLATNRITLSLQYELEEDHIVKNPLANLALTRADVERLRFPEGVTLLHSLRPQIAIDYRDNSTHPRRGWFAGAMLELSHSIGSGADDYLFGLIPGSDVYTSTLKYQVTLSGYLPVGLRSVLALSLRTGQIYPLSAADDSGRLNQTIAPKRFFLGGASTMRGYGEDEMVPEDVRDDFAAQRARCAGSATGLGCSGTGGQLVAGNTLVSLGGQSFLLMKAELRIPLRGSLEAGIFADIGNLWFDYTGSDPTRHITLRVNTGVGLRFVTPIGPAVVDLGFNLAPDPRVNESTVAPHFSIGLF